jgi:hypothetical protein
MIHQKMIALKSQVAASTVILIAFRWREWAIERLEQTLEHLALSNSQKLFLITNKSFEDNPRRYLSVAEVELPDLRFPVYPGLIERNSRLASAVPPETLIVDIPQLICAGRTLCPVFTPEGRLISFDGMHLTEFGARYLGRMLFAAPPLVDFFDYSMPTQEPNT